MPADIKKLKDIRQKMGVSVADIRKALEETNNDQGKAEDLLRSWGLEKAAKKADRAVGAGLVETYMHAGGRVGAMVEVACETDFVARTEDFKTFAHDVAMQVAAMDPKDVDALLSQEFIKDSSQTIEDVRKSVITKLGENIVIKRFMRFELGE